MATPLRIVVLILLACGGFFAAPAFAAEENIRTPSDQMKEAVGKVGKAPATIGKSLQDLTDAAKEKLRQTFGAKSNPEVKPAPSDLTLPKKSPEGPAPAVKMDASQRDPFQRLTPGARTPLKRRPRENLSPLEQKDLSQLNLVGIIQGNKEPMAIIVDTSGVSYFITVGTPIGENDGVVKGIDATHILIEEFCDVDGIRKKCDRTKALPGDRQT